MVAILKREFRAYFQSPLGYVFIAAVYFFSGYYFFTYNLYGATTNMSRLYELLFPVVLFLIPVLTMRLMSEDKRLKTDQLLLTSPVPRLGIAMGKYGAAVAVYLIAISSTLLQAVVLAFFAAPHWPTILGNFVGLFLLGSTLIAICMALSALTESQVIAAVAGFVVSLFLMLVDALALVVSSSFLQALFRNLSFNDRYTPFTLGIFELPNVVFFLSISALFILLTWALLDRQRWS
ncbi:MAG: ABC transporter [Anaerolineae bacterium]|jgi:ABC-2 type transport system permease protein|nr:ABC transporter [Anaerolineae bacterium]